MTNPDDPALPGSKFLNANPGLTKRELFAAFALLGLWATTAPIKSSITGLAIELADKLIEKLNGAKEE